MITHIDYGAPLGNSDHSTLTFEYHCYVPVPTEKNEKFLYHKGNYDRMAEDLRLDWDELLETCRGDPDQQYNLFISKLNEAQSQHIPKMDTNKARKRRKFPLDLNARRLIAKKNIAWRRYMETRSDDRRRGYTRLRNKVTKMTRQAKRRHEEHIASQVKDNPKSFWRYANSRLKTRVGVSDLCDPSKPRQGGKPTMATTDPEKAEVLAEFFSSVFVQEPEGEVPQPDGVDITIPFHTELITDEMVEKKLSQLDPSKAQGPDAVHPRVLKELRGTLARPIRIIYESTLRTGRLPTLWKRANISAIFKKGSRREAGNYRPVSLTSVVCKIQEKFVRDWLMTHLRENHILSPQQYGFVSGRSTTIQLLQVMEKWTAILDEGGEIDVLYFDFKKAFDTVAHKRLLSKLQAYGVSETIVRWIQNFLTGRQQRVVVNGKTSGWRPITSGIPQGSVLGPVLFVIYINDLPEAVRSMMFLFADDAKLYRHIQSQHDRVLMQRDVHGMEDWSDEWLLRFHPKKCEAMRVGARDRDQGATPYTLKDAQTGTDINLQTSTEVRDVGVIIDNQLTFDAHISTCVKKANRLVGLIRRTYTYLGEGSFRLLFKSLVRPHFEYAVSVWNTSRNLRGCNAALRDNYQHSGGYPTGNGCGD
jgi:hypothetical protein